jgi:alanyl-tRNA synthetase
MAKLDGGDANALRATADQLKARLGSAVIVLAATLADGKVPIVSAVSRDLTPRVKAGELVSALAGSLGGRGGGKPEFAQGSGNSSANLDAGLASLEVKVRELLSKC